MNTSYLNPIALAIILAFGTQSAHSQTTSNTGTLPTVTVTSERSSGYLSNSASSATRMDIPINETPLSVSIVDETLIQDKAIRKPSELADVVSSVQQVNGYGNAPSQMFIIRGFSNSAVNYRDGFRSYDPYVPRDFANVERVDFVKGPSSVLYGNAPPAGAVNTVTKTPFFSDYNYVDYSIGSWATNRVTGDFNKAFDQFAVRLNMSVNNSLSYIDYEKSKSVLFAPSIKLKATRDTEVIYAYEYNKSRTDGLANGLPMSPETFNLRTGATVGQPWAYQNAENSTHRLEFKSQLNKQWQFRQGLFSATTKRDYFGVSPDGSYASTLAASNVFYNAGPIDDTTNNSAQSELIGSILIGSYKHKVLVGYERVLSEYRYGFYDQAFGTSVSYNTGLPDALSSTFTGSISSSKAETSAVYINDHITYRNWRLLAGLRSDNVAVSRSTDSKSESVLTGRLGAMYFIIPSTAAYYSWGQSFVPNLGTTSTLAVLDPEKGTQHEIGIKHTFKPGLEATVAAFDITKKNIRMSDGVGYYKTAGEHQSSGYEASLVGQVNSQFKLIANYSHLDKAKISQADSNVGNTLYGVAKDMWNTWGVYSLKSKLPGALSVGLGIVNVGDRYADEANSVTLPGYTRFDAGIYYKVKKLTYALNLKNITNANIFDTAEGYYIHRQAPQSILLTAGFVF